MATSTDSVELVGDETVKNIARAALFAALTGAFAYVSFPNPVSPAPVTLQVLGVFLAGIFLGPVWGGLSMVLYLAAGAAGAPIFSGGGAGLGSLLADPTLGYLWSYPFAATLVGALVHRGGSLRNLWETSTPVLVGAMVAGTVVIYALGMAGLMFVLGIGVAEAFAVGAAAFLPAEALKIAAAVIIVRSDVVAAS
jgi:biotin transport system substrate-specific component